MPSRKIRQGSNPSMMSGNPYDDDDIYTVGCLPPTCRCSGGGCLTSCCDVIPIQPGEGGGTCLGWNCEPSGKTYDSVTRKRRHRRRRKLRKGRKGWK